MSRRSEDDLRKQHHALLNHVAIVCTYAHLLKDTELDADQRELVSDLLASADEAHALADGLGLALDLYVNKKGSANGTAPT